jgi:hypothetical protein
MPIGQRLLPGKEHRHPRIRALASASVQVRMKLPARYFHQARTREAARALMKNAFDAHVTRHFAAGMKL